MGLVDDEIYIYYGNEDVLVSMASAKMRDILEYIHKCSEIQCPEWNTVDGLKKIGDF